MTLLPMIPNQIKEHPHVSREQAELIWSKARTLSSMCFIKALWFTGLRISEVLAWRIRDFKSADGNFSMDIVRLKKRTKTVETLPLPYGLGDALNTLIVTLKLKPSDKFFSLHINTYRYELKAAAKKAGLENWQKIHPHLFRHGFVYDKVSKNMNPFLVSKLVGHQNLGITLGYYQPTEDDVRRAMRDNK